MHLDSSLYHCVCYLLETSIRKGKLDTQTCEEPVRLQHLSLCNLMRQRYQMQSVVGAGKGLLADLVPCDVI